MLEETDVMEPELDQEIDQEQEIDPQIIDQELQKEPELEEPEAEKKPEEEAKDEDLDSLREELEEEEFEVTLEGEESKEPEDLTQEQEGDSSTFRTVRKVLKNTQKELRAAQQELKQLKGKQQSIQEEEKAIELGKYPEAEDEGIEYDTEKLVNARIAWKERQKQIEVREAEKREKQQKEQEAWQEKLGNYRQRAAALNAPDYQEAEDEARSSLNEVTQSIIVDQSKEPEKIVYAIGKREDIRKQFQEANGNPVQIGRLLERLEKSMSITPKRKAPPAEKKVTGGSSSSGSYEAMMERAEKKAAKTGDRTEIIRLKQQKLKT